MINHRRFTYFLLIILVVLLGLTSRQISFIPLIFGDVLWASMMFLIIKFLLIHKSLMWISITSLLICFSVEISQLYHAPWIDSIRNTTLGALVLGHGFLWSDLLAYTAGIAICIAGHLFYSNKSKPQVLVTKIKQQK